MAADPWVPDNNRLQILVTNTGAALLTNIAAELIVSVKSVVWIPQPDELESD